MRKAAAVLEKLGVPYDVSSLGPTRQHTMAAHT